MSNATEPNTAAPETTNSTEISSKLVVGNTAATGAVEYDRELIADMLEAYIGAMDVEPSAFRTESIETQIELLREADNRDAAGVHTTCRPTNTAAPGMGDAIPDAETFRLRMGELTTEQVQIAQAAYRMALAAQPAPVVGGVGYGIIDPDYARIFTVARVLCWSEGYALTMHGSFTRDLDLVAVPWIDRAREPEHLARRILETCGLKDTAGNPGEKSHGRLVWTMRLPDFGDPRFVDFSVMPPSPLLSARPGGEGDWYTDVDTGSHVVDISTDGNRQLALILKKDGTVQFAAYVDGERTTGDAMDASFVEVVRAWSAHPAQAGGE